jgi:16S rRNA (cytidine1402-2'-O)-methyltransferase
MAQGKLYIVSTPIGNLEDMSARAARILAEADCIAAEDTRHTAQLLNSLGIRNRLISFHEHSRRERAEELVEMLLEGQNIALVTDAGTPIISDPGEQLTKLAAERGIEILSVPGACAAIAALTVSALDAGKFVFEGFLPRDKTRAQALQTAISHPYTTILYESPHQLRKTLEELAALCPERPMAICKELTKIYETVFRGTAAQLLQQSEGWEIRGEYILVLGGAPVERQEVEDKQILEAARACTARGMRSKEAARWVAEQLGVGKNRVYQLLLDQQERSK